MNTTIKTGQAGAKLPKTLEFQLFETYIDLTWVLLNMADKLKAQGAGPQAADAYRRAKAVLSKAKSHATGLTPVEKAAAFVSVEVLDNVMNGFDTLP